MSGSYRTLLLVLCLLPVAALAGRSIKEPGPVKAVPRMVPAAKRAEALKAAGLEKQCTAATLRSRELPGVACRLAIFSHLTAAEPIVSPNDVKKKVRAAKNALSAAKSIAAYKPLARKPGLERKRLDAHQQACKTVLHAYDALANAARSAGAAKSAALAAMGTNEKGLFRDACECARDTVGMGAGAGLSADKLGGLQTLLTKRSCFLDKSKIKAGRGGPENEFTGRAGQVVESNTDEARLLDYAKARDIGLDRCRKKATSAGRVTDRGRLKRCACGEIKRWRFPKERGRGDVEIVVPIIKGVGVRLTVTAPGKISQCGPLEGSGL